MICKTHEKAQKEDQNFFFRFGDNNKEKKKRGRNKINDCRSWKCEFKLMIVCQLLTTKEINMIVIVYMWININLTSSHVKIILIWFIKESKIFMKITNLICAQNIHTNTCIVEQRKLSNHDDLSTDSQHENWFVISRKTILFKCWTAHAHALITFHDQSC